MLQVLAHNAAVARGGPDVPTHKLRLNRFADWTLEEYRSIMLSKRAWSDEGEGAAGGSGGATAAKVGLCLCV